jgi:hypothetical protein
VSIRKSGLSGDISDFRLLAQSLKSHWPSEDWVPMQSARNGFDLVILHCYSGKSDAMSNVFVNR